jgi:hypothetical protein
MNQVKRKILQIVDRSSGGIKFIELLVEFLKFDEFGNNICDSLREMNMLIPDLVEKIIREEIEELDILEYAMDMGDTERIKMFVYRKIKNNKPE